MLVSRCINKPAPDAAISTIPVWVVTTLVSTPTTKTSTKRRTPANSRQQKKQPKRLTRKAVNSNRPRASKNNMNTMTTIPAQVAYQINQPFTEKSVTMTFCDALQPLAVAQNTASGKIYSFPLNPATMGGRISLMCRLYQQFVFESVELSLCPNVAPGSAGNYIIAYTTNPDQDFDSALAVQQVFALPGASNSPWWLASKCIAKPDKSKRLNIDADSNERAMTTAGKFLVVNVSAPSVTGTVLVPVFIKYTIRLFGTAIQNTIPTLAIFPAGTFTRTLTTSFFTFVPSAGEPALPVLVVGKPYYVTPVFNLLDNNAETMDVGVIELSNATNYSFYESMEDWQKQAALDNISLTQITQRVTLSTPN